jgi:hypothetical protein
MVVQHGVQQRALYRAVLCIAGFYFEVGKRQRVTVLTCGFLGAAKQGVTA